MTGLPLLHQDQPSLPEPWLGKQSISRLSANNHSNLLAGQFRDVYISENRNLNDELNSLPTAADAPFSAFYQQQDSFCLPNTRTSLLQDIDSWIGRQDNQCIFWLSGLAGTGKSTIARTIARKYFQKQYLGASFFFSRGGGDTGNAIKFVTTIVKQLATNVPSLKQHICDAIRVRPNITSDSLHDQWQHLVLSPLSKLSENRGQGTYVLIVDALDECDNNGNIDIIIKLLGEARTLNTARLRIFLTSRPEIPIRNGFIQIPDAEHQNFVLHHISPSIVDRDIAVFFEHHFKLIGQENDLDTSWPGKEVIQQLIEAAGGLFIWAATACRFIREGLFVDERVQFLLEGSTSTTTPEEHLNKLYITVLKKSIRPDYTIGEKEALYMLLRYILGSIVILYSPLSASSLDKLLGVPKQRMKQALKDFHAILDIPNADIHPLRLHRPSFRDFLLNNERCRDLNFWVHEKQIHKRLADCCIKLMSTSLRKDICGVNAPNKFAAEAERSWIELSLPPEVQYACRYWINHIRKSSAQLCDNGEVHLFLQKHLLHWMEALGWLGKISEGVHAITALESFVSSSECPGLWSFVHDAKRFVLYSRLAIEQAPLQTYSSAIVFAPTLSIIRENFKECIPGWIGVLPKVEEKWNAVLQTLEGHGGRVTSVAFSPDSTRLASGSYDDTVKIWDASSGECLSTLRGHRGRVTSVAFSPDSTRLASGSSDNTVKIWDASSGECLSTLEGHRERVTSVAFSPDSTQLASGSYDDTVKIWDASSGKCLSTLRGYRGRVTSVAFSPDSTQLASGSWDETVKIWDASSGECLSTLEGHRGSVTSVAFSPDSTRLASRSDDETVKIWDASSGECLSTLEGHRRSVTSVAFSPDSTRLASGSDDDTVKQRLATVGVSTIMYDSIRENDWYWY